MTATPETNGVADFDFSHLEIEQATAKYKIPMVSSDAFLIVRPAMAENERFNAASLRLSGKRQRSLTSGAPMTSSDLDQDRNEDRILYPKYVIVGWGGIFAKTGELVPFNYENCKQFIAKLPRWIFDPLRLFCMRPERFLPDDDLAEQQEPNPVEVAGN